MYLNLEILRNEFKVYRTVDLQVAKRIEILIEVTKIELKYHSCVDKKAKTRSLSDFCLSININVRSLQRWKKIYREIGVLGLKKKDAPGKAPLSIRPRIRRVIDAYRIMYRWGSEVIQAHLERDHKYTVSRFKIDKYLKESELATKYPCTTRKKKLNLKKKHTKVVHVLNPGAHTQMDVKYQTHLLLNKNKSYVYNFIDHASNWSFKYAYPAFNAKNTENFMERLLQVVPFYICRLQTDNGIEFTFKWVSKASDDPKAHPLKIFCEKYGINHKLIPPGEKELQGLVERSHRQDDQELFSRINPQGQIEFDQHLEKYWKARNAQRRFKKLSWLTPDNWLENHLIRNLAIILYWKEIQAEYIKEENRLKNRTEIEEILDILKENRDRAFGSIKMAA